MCKCQLFHLSFFVFGEALRPPLLFLLLSRDPANCYAETLLPSFFLSAFTALLFLCALTRCVRNPTSFSLCIVCTKNSPIDVVLGPTSGLLHIPIPSLFLWDRSPVPASWRTTRRPAFFPLLTTWDVRLLLSAILFSVRCLAFSQSWRTANRIRTATAEA